MIAVTHVCEHCGRKSDPLAYHTTHDEYWCESCLDNEAEAAYERSLEDEPPETTQEQYERAWNEKQRLK